MNREQMTAGLDGAPISETDKTTALDRLQARADEAGTPILSVDFHDTENGVFVQAWVEIGEAYSETVAKT